MFGHIYAVYVFLLHSSNTLSDTHALTVQRLRGAPLIWVVTGSTNTLLIAVHVLLLRSPADGSMLAKHGSNAASVLGKQCSVLLDYDAVETLGSTGSEQIKLKPNCLVSGLMLMKQSSSSEAGT